uniref:RRN3 homolog, RNA polymerase I transcription factor n=1 Tax=Myripristis murdjan TaxID=586833 RepID=A0A667YP03_9TELE
MKTVRFGGTVAETLAKYKQGDTRDYDLLKYQLADPEIKDAQIINWLQEFRNCVTQLSKDHEELIYTILRVPWVGRSLAVVEEYLAFLGNLVSAQTVYLCACLRMVVSHFIPSRFPLLPERGPYVTTHFILICSKYLPRNFDRCHQALQVIARYVPSTSRFLMPILHEKFPFVQKSSRTLECYVHNLLRVTVYIPSIRREVLEVIIGKMLKLDVSASRSEIEEVEENAMQNQTEESAEEGLFDMDEDVSADKSCRTGVMTHPVAERLDTLMAVVMAYIRDICHVNGCLDVERTKELYRDLLSVFDKLILPTHASSHVQYTVFYLCSFRQALAEAFLDHLWKILQSPSQPAVLRQAAAGYMGSFLARAKFIPVATVRACLDLLLPWIHHYIDSQDSSGRQACCDVNLHGPFYTACQSVFYIIIFKHKAILEGNMKKGLAYLQSLNLERVVMCQLNPLKVCLSSVTSVFAAITRSGQLIEPLYQVWEEPADTELHSTKTGQQEDEDDFLCGETPQAEGVVGMTPGSYDSNLRSPSSVGSPPVAFQRPF